VTRDAQDILDQLVNAKLALAESETEIARLRGDVRRLRQEADTTLHVGDEDLADRLVQAKLELSAARQEAMGLREQLAGAEAEAARLREGNTHYGSRNSQLEIKVIRLEEELARARPAQ
jgi:regulator of replication initiation timing